MPNPSQKLDLLAMLLPKRRLLKSAPSQNLRWQRQNLALHVNRATQMLVVAPNRRVPKYGELSAVMMFGILPANHNARVAKSQLGLAAHAIDMKTIVQLVHHANITTKHQVAHHAPVVTKLLLARHASTTTKLLLARHEQSGKKYMHQSLGCHVKKFQPNA
jgi:hypothetical protein